MADSSKPKAGGLWGRLFGLRSDGEEPEPDREAPAPTEPASEATAPAPLPPPAPEPPPAPPPTAAPPPAPEPAVAEEPRFKVVATLSAADLALPPLSAPPLSAPPLSAPPPTVETASAAPQPCPACGTISKPQQRYCEDCGWMFTANGSAQAAPAETASAASPALSPRGSDMPTSTQALLRDRYELRQMIAERQGTRRFRGFDHATGQSVVIIASMMPDAAAIVEASVVSEDEILPGFDDDVPVAAVVGGNGASGWPAASWEKQILDKANHPALPRVVDTFVQDGAEYLIEQMPIGNSLWDAWDEAEDANTRYGWAKQVAEALHALHGAGAILEGVRPDLVIIDDGGSAVLADLSDLLPIPLPPSPPLRANLYTAPELIVSPQSADARSDLYSFGAMLYSLEYLHHAPEEKDFEAKFVPRQITDRYPDVHPLLLRLVNKTFVRDVNTRFPTDEAGRTDPTGFVELIKTLEVCRRTFDRVRLDIAAWTTTGMVRTGNEDAFALLHSIEQRQDDLYEYAVVLLCDGMGGYDAGEVAAAIAMSKMREYVLQQPMFSGLAEKDPPAGPPDIKALQEVLSNAVRHANKEVYTAARTPGKGKRGMGCTGECVYIDARNVAVGHVGDSRTYHLRRGRLMQLTRDQTFVNRMVELGQLTAEEAENHPRKNELQQAIGGQPDVVPGVSTGKLQRGDWVLVCSDGLTNHISNSELEKMLTREAAYSAEEAARRLLNLTNLRGATDNATIVVIRAS